MIPVEHPVVWADLPDVHVDLDALDLDLRATDAPTAEDPR